MTSKIHPNSIILLVSKLTPLTGCQTQFTDILSILHIGRQSPIKQMTVPWAAQRITSFYMKGLS